MATGSKPNHAPVTMVEAARKTTLAILHGVAVRAMENIERMGAHLEVATSFTAGIFQQAEIDFSGEPEFVLDNSNDDQQHLETSIFAQDPATATSIACDEPQPQAGNGQQKNCKSDRGLESAPEPTDGASTNCVSPEPVTKELAKVSPSQSLTQAPSTEETPVVTRRASLVDELMARITAGNTAALPPLVVPPMSEEDKQRFHEIQEALQEVCEHTTKRINLS